jgi:hypothetical protein
MAIPSFPHGKKPLREINTKKGVIPYSILDVERSMFDVHSFAHSKRYFDNPYNPIIRSQSVCPAFQMLAPRGIIIQNGILTNTL